MRNLVRILRARCKIVYFISKKHQQALLSFAIVDNVYAETVEEKFDRAVQYHKQQNYQAAFSIFKELAEQGYASPQFNLGLMYDQGQGVRQDYHQAFKWYQKAAK